MNGSPRNKNSRTGGFVDYQAICKEQKETIDRLDAKVMEWMDRAVIAENKIAALEAASRAKDAVVEAARVVIAGTEAFFYKNKPLELNPLAKALSALNQSQEGK